MASDDAETILLGMYMMTAIDGGIDKEELKTLFSLTKQIPMFKEIEEKRIKEIIADKIPNMVHQEGGGNNALKAITNISPENANKLFVAVVECACASNGIDEAKKSLIEEIYEKLNIDKKFAKNVIEVFDAKYSV